jgi:AcrR family transcriptional regulator
MSKQTRKKQFRALRQTEIIEAAVKLFGTRGIENTTMDDIARQAEFTKQTLYSYFASKEDLYVAVFLLSIQERWQFQRSAMDACPNGLEKLRTFGRTYYSFFSGHSMYLNLMLYLDYLGIDIKHTDHAIFAKYKACNDEMVDYLRSAFRQAIAEGSVREDIDVGMTISHWGYSLRAILHRALQKSYSFSKIDPEKYYHSFLDTLLLSITTGATAKGKNLPSTGFRNNDRRKTHHTK